MCQQQQQHQWCRRRLLRRQQQWELHILESRLSARAGCPPHKSLARRTKTRPQECLSETFCQTWSRRQDPARQRQCQGSCDRRSWSCSRSKYGLRTPMARGASGQLDTWTSSRASRFAHGRPPVRRRKCPRSPWSGGLLCPALAGACREMAGLARRASGKRSCCLVPMLCLGAYRNARSAHGPGGGCGWSPAGPPCPGHRERGAAAAGAPDPSGFQRVARLFDLEPGLGAGLCSSRLRAEWPEAARGGPGMQPLHAL
mmetsp:Transcript_43976/g.125401  ORF Transcript_43976/g.125401 Transcript_43976/m.125401 type:complete len:257 (-) Transcript_43976:904-1674(-)